MFNEDYIRHNQLTEHLLNVEREEAYALEVERHEQCLLCVNRASVILDEEDYFCASCFDNGNGPVVEHYENVGIEAADIEKLTTEKVRIL
jgi:hypothetical protein